MKIFNYSTFETRLEKKTRTLFLSFLDKDFGILESLFEFESLLSWCKNRLEIHSISISSESEIFDLNLKNQDLGKLKTSYMEKIQQKIFSLGRQMMEAPQTVFFDLGGNPHSWVFQISLGADIRLAKTQKNFNINPLGMGLSPSPGILSLSGELFGQALTKRIFMGGACQQTQSLSQLGVLHTYENENRDSFLRTHLEGVASQAPIPRIQTKLALNTVILDRIANTRKIEDKTFQAAQMAQDWKNSRTGEFTPAQHMAYILQYLEKTDIDAQC